MENLSHEEAFIVAAALAHYRRSFGPEQSSLPYVALVGDLEARFLNHSASMPPSMATFSVARETLDPAGTRPDRPSGQPVGRS